MFGKVQYTPASPGRFKRALQSFTEEHPEYDPFLTTDRDFSECDCYLDSWGESGYAITDEKEIVALFNGKEKSLGDQLVFSALKNGGRWLNCFEGALASFYFRYGFRTVAHIEWDEEQAPDNWDYDEYGRPNVIFMTFNPRGGSMNIGESESETWESAATTAKDRARDL